MPKLSEYERYMDHLCEVLGHADRCAGFSDYSRGLMLPIQRKSVEPLAAYTDPWKVSSKHQSLHHLVAKSEWSDEAVLARVREWVSPSLGLAEGTYWIVDDTGFPKKGLHSVGVARQYCGQLGKQDNCQVAVSLSLASARGSIPIQWQLYLPKEWAADKRRRAKAGIPENIEFTTKPELSLEQIRAAHASGVPQGVVLADAAYGTETLWRESLSELGLKYCVGVRTSTSVWAPGTGPLPPKVSRKKRSGRPAKLLRRDRAHQPTSVKDLALSLPLKAWHTVSWREGTNQTLRSRFATVRVRAAHHDYWRSEVRKEEWLLIEWPKDEAEPIKYWLSTLPMEASPETLVGTAMMRWRIERDYQELKQEFGLDHFEGRGWRGFHHHATLCIAAYGFLMAHRLKRSGVKKNSARPKAPGLPDGYTPRGSRTNATTRARLHRHTARTSRSTHRSGSQTMPVLWRTAKQTYFVTQ